MNYGDRFYFQLAFPLVICFLLVEDPLRVQRFGVLLLGTILVPISVGELNLGLAYYPCLKRAQVDLGHRLAPFAAGHTILLGDAGVIPYFSGWQTYDFLGLATNQIAREGVRTGMLHDLHPDLILVYSTTAGPALLSDGRDQVGGVGEATTLRYIREAGDYTYAGESQWRDFYLVAFLRNGIPQHDAIQQQISLNTISSARTHISIRALLLQQYVPWKP